MPESEYNRQNALTSLDGRYRPQVESLTINYLSEGALMRTRVEVEARYLLALSDATTPHGFSANLVRQFTPTEREYLLALGQSLPDADVARIQEIEKTTGHDVKAMEIWFREHVKGTSLENVTEKIHFGLTSEDTNNLAYRLMWERARKEEMVPAAEAVVDNLVEAALLHKADPMLARTHGQPAVPTTVGKELMNFATRVQQNIKTLQDVSLRGKLNGAVGNYNALVVAGPEIDWIDFSRQFVESIGFDSTVLTTQINKPDDIMAMLHAYQDLNYAILDIDMDMWRYISDGWFVQKVNKGEIGSSTMPHKVNPKQFENSAGTARLATGFATVIIDIIGTSQLQRDLINSPAVRAIGEVLGYSLVSYKSVLEGLQRATPNLDAILESLNNDWSILSEAVQTRLRREGYPDPYMLMANLTRGRRITANDWQEFVANLPADVSKEAREELAALTPETYIGEAVRLTELGAEEIQKMRQAA